MILIITAGRWPAASRSAWQAAANTLRQRRIEIYPIGVGAAVERPQLAVVASNPGFVFTPASYAALRSEREPVIRTIVYGGTFLYLPFAKIYEAKITARRVKVYDHI